MTRKRRLKMKNNVSKKDLFLPLPDNRFRKSKSGAALLAFISPKGGITAGPELLLFANADSWREAGYRFMKRCHKTVGLHRLSKKI